MTFCFKKQFEDHPESIRCFECDLFALVKLNYTILCGKLMRANNEFWSHLN